MSPTHLEHQVPEHKLRHDLGAAFLMGLFVSLMIATVLTCAVVLAAGASC